MTENDFPDVKCPVCGEKLSYQQFFDVDNGDSEVYGVYCTKCDKLIYYAKKEKYQ